jgi:hypothetical protein
MAKFKDGQVQQWPSSRMVKFKPGAGSATLKGSLRGMTA